MEMEMIIHCSKDFLEELRKNCKKFNEKYIDDIVEDMGAMDSLFVWHAKVFRVNRRKTVVLVNEKNRFSVVMYGLKAVDFKSFEKYVLEAIRTTFQRALINENIINSYIYDCERVIFSKSKNRKTVAWVNDAAEKACFFIDPDIDGNMYMEQAAGVAISKRVVSRNSKDNEDGFVPFKMMLKDLEEKYNLPSCGFNAVKLRVSLNFSDSVVSRVLLVPVCISFLDLHRILQVTFNWQDYHLFSFDFDNLEFPSIRIINYDDEFESVDINDLAKKVAINLGREYDGAVRYYNLLASQTPLLRVINNYKKFSYTYDFGDNWTHNMEVLEYINNYEEVNPICISGLGNAPPEDVGGAGGYGHFIDAYYDHTHPEHDDVVAWSEIVNYCEFDIDKINKKLSTIMSGDKFYLL